MLFNHKNRVNYEQLAKVVIEKIRKEIKEHFAHQGNSRSHPPAGCIKALPHKLFHFAIFAERSLITALIAVPRRIYRAFYVLTEFSELLNRLVVPGQFNGTSPWLPVKLLLEISQWGAVSSHLFRHQKLTSHSGPVSAPTVRPLPSPVFCAAGLSPQPGKENTPAGQIGRKF